MCASGRDMRCEVRLKRPQAVQWVWVEASVSATGRDSVLLKFALSDISREKKSEEQISFQNYCLAPVSYTHLCQAVWPGGQAHPYLAG